jgi:hypothetical protein
LNGSFIHALEQKLWERCVLMKVKSTFLPPNDLPPLVRMAGRPGHRKLALAERRPERQSLPRQPGHPVDVGFEKVKRVESLPSPEVQTSRNPRTEAVP